MAIKIRSITPVPLLASFADMFGGQDSVPPQLSSPASHFRRVPRVGQMATIVVAESDEGVRGYGECFGLPHPLSATAIVRHVIAPALRDVEYDDPAVALKDLQMCFAALGAIAGPAMEALSGVDIALWDLKARTQGQALATTLGASPGPVAVYVSPVPFLDAPDQSAETAAKFVAGGFRAVKLKVGRGVETDVSHVAAIRSALPSVPLYLDFQLRLRCHHRPLEATRAFEPYDVGWLEEPIAPGDPAALASVRRASRIPIAAGENEFALPSFERLLRAEAVDFVQPNIARAGGVSGLIAIGRLCTQYGAKLAVHGVGAAVPVAAALHTLRAAEAVHAFEANRLLNPLRDTMSERPPRLEDGALVTPEGVGHGSPIEGYCFACRATEEYQMDLRSTRPDAFGSLSMVGGPSFVATAAGESSLSCHAGSVAD